MTNDRALKQAVRERMRLHGEKYTVARRHILAHTSHEAPVGEPLEEPIADDAPTVIRRFIDAVVINVPAGAGAATAQACVEFEATPRSQTGECVRLYALLTRAYRIWCAGAVAATRRDGMLQGLRSLGVVFDAGSAAYVGEMLGTYRRSIEQEPGSMHVPDALEQRADQDDRVAREVLLRTQKAMRAASGFANEQSCNIPAADRMLSVESCAAALVAAFNGAVVTDLPQETAETVRAIQRA